MASRERQHTHSYDYDYEHLVVDPASLGVPWADPAAVEIPPQLLAALGEYLSGSAARGDVEAEAEADDEFMMHEFKVRRCARARSHDWTACPYAHPGAACRRRVCFFAHAAAELRAAAAAKPKPKDGCSPLALSLSLSPKSTLQAALWESPPVSPVEGRRWVDEPSEDADADTEMEELMLAMRDLSFRKAQASPAPVLPAVTEDDGPDLGWVSELVM